MKNYDQNGNELNMQTELSQLIDDITARLMEMTKEERIAWFRRSMYPEPLNFINEIDGTQYIVRTFFDETATESIEEKIQRITTKTETNFELSL